MTASEIDQAVDAVEVVRCRTCGVKLGGIYGAEPGGFCRAHAANGRVDNTGSVDELAREDEVHDAQALLGIGGRP